MSKTDYYLYSDGGSRSNKLAAGACIIADSKNKPLIRLIAYLEEGTNNEAEISGALIGFAYLRLLMKKEGLEKIKVDWVCDSEYVLKSATEYINNWQKNGWKTASKEPVKNQGLWRIYLKVSKGILITPEHVYGHSGHPQNEACDTAVNWVRDCKDDLLKLASKKKMVEVKIEALKGNSKWNFIDAREFIDQMRESNTPDLESIKLLTRPLSILLELPVKNDTKSTVITNVLAKLQDALNLFDSVDNENTKETALKLAIKELLKKFN